jgi:hypothetical protein
LFFGEGFWLSLRTKRDRKKTREKEWEGEKENIFVAGCLLAFDSRRRLVEKAEEEEKKTEEQKKGLSAQAACPSID